MAGVEAWKDFYLTQALTGHDRFNAYFYRFARSEHADCIFCHEYDDAEHALFNCEAIILEKINLGTEVTVENMTALMVRKTEKR